MNQDTWKKIFDYENGNLIWKIKPTKSRVQIGQIAGKENPEKNGYRKIGYKYKTYLAHRIVWEFHKGCISKNLVIDHINGNRIDNRIENLRLVSQSVNAKNTYKHRSGKIIGICKVKNKWRVTLNFGTFDSEEEAKMKVIEIQDKLNGDLK